MATETVKKTINFLVFILPALVYKNHTRENENRSQDLLPGDGLFQHPAGYKHRINGGQVLADDDVETKNGIGDEGRSVSCERVFRFHTAKLRLRYRIRIDYFEFVICKGRASY